MNRPTSTPRRVLGFLATLAVAVSLTACGTDEQVGDEALLQFDQQEQGGAFGATTVLTTAPVAVETTAPPATPPPTAGSVAATTATTLPPEQQEVTVEVAINGASPYFDPGVVTVLVGSKVRFVNRDTVVHSVLSDIGAFDSGPIAPGAVWIYDATTPGQFNYSDGGRPFAVGSIQVQ